MYFIRAMKYYYVRSVGVDFCSAMEEFVIRV